MAWETYFDLSYRYKNKTTIFPLCQGDMVVLFGWIDEKDYDTFV